MTEPNLPTYTLEDVLLAAKRAVGVKGEDYVYAKPEGVGACVYFHHGQPSCLVGHVLADFGIRVSDSHNMSGFTAVVDHLPAHFEAEAVDFLEQAQMSQDSGRPWGQAVDMASSIVLSQQYEEDES